MSHKTLRLMALCAVLAMSVTTLAAQRVVGRFGEAFIQGRRAVVEVLVVVPPGLDENRVANAALQNQGARPIDSQSFVTTGLNWGSGGVQGSPNVTQIYITSNQAAGAQTAFTNGQGTWNSVSESTFMFSSGASQQSGCPSLVRECPGKQTFDGVNHVGWLSIKGCCTLGVTWFGEGEFGPEADMAYNTDFPWSTDGSDFDIETVGLHELGHVLGLGHSGVLGAVMEATYAGARRNLHVDDRRGVTYLYPASNQTGSISGTVRDTGATAIAGATVSVDTTPLFAVTDTGGAYSIDGIPAIGTYELTATADGFEATTILSFSVGASNADFQLTGSNDGGGDDPGGCVPKGPFGRNCQ